jgi:hypothetical protein
MNFLGFIIAIIVIIVFYRFVMAVPAILDNSTFGGC